MKRTVCLVREWFGELGLLPKTLSQIQVKEQLCYLSDWHLPSMWVWLSPQYSLYKKGRKGRTERNQLKHRVLFLFLCVELGTEARLLHMLGQCCPIYLTTALETHRSNASNHFQNEGRMETCFLRESEEDHQLFSISHLMSMLLLRKSATPLSYYFLIHINDTFICPLSSKIAIERHAHFS